MTIDAATIESYASMSMDELRAEYCHYSDEFESADNATKRMFALDDMNLFRALIDDRDAGRA